MEQSEKYDPVLHVIVVGFHHKKGCQVEYSYPPLIEGNSVESHEIPEEWKNIPSLALPDGAHNFVKDTVFFLLPGRRGGLQTVYGVSCYRQMDAKDLINKTADVTRSTVQKSVCVLSRLPLFGLIKAKLELITHAYFDEKDFTQVDLLEQTYNNLNSSLNQSLLEGSQVFLGLSVRSLVALYQHKIILLFKLLLLERRVLMFGSPVESLCETILGIVSLFPGMLENGLGQACNQWNKKLLSPTLSIAKISQDEAENDQFLEVHYHTQQGNKAENNPPSPEVRHHTMNHVSLEDHRKSESIVHNQSEAPESPSIPREPFFIQGSDDKNNTTDNNTLCQIKPFTTSDKVMPNSSATEEQVPKTDLSPTSPNKEFLPLAGRSNSINDSDKLSVHVSHRGKKDCGDEGEGTHLKHGNTETSEDSPLAHVDEITHIEAVQCRMSKLNAHMDTSDNRSNVQNDLSLDSTVNLTGSFETIEELDSPESIREIDSEDCFSWEQDRLQLTLHDDDDDDGAKDEVDASKETPSADRTLDSINSKSLQNTDFENVDVASVSSDSTSTSTSAQGDENSKEKTNNKKAKAFKNKLSAAFSKVGNKSKAKSAETSPFESTEVCVSLIQDKLGHPLAVFTNGSVCYPYLSLQYHDILTDVNIRCFFIGATNVLFKQRRQLIDVLVEIEDGKIDIRDKELQRQLSLTTADLRFAEYLVKMVTEERQGSYLDSTEWEGSEEWLRAQFKHYLNSLLSTVVHEDTRLLEDFGMGFISAWKTTYNYRHWRSKSHPHLENVSPGHPFQGNLSMADVRVKFNHTLQNSERGRKINAAMVQTGKYVVQTGKAVGGALTSAKSVMSTWFSSWRQPNKSSDTEDEPQEQNESPVEDIPDHTMCGGDHGK